MKQFSSAFLATILLSFVFLTFSPLSVHASVDNSNIVINQVQIAGLIAADEFVELYNPTDKEIDLSGWRLTKFSSTGNEANLQSNITGTIAPYSYFLIGSNSYDAEIVPDIYYSTQSSIPINGAVKLYSDTGSTEVDTVGFGESLIFEAQSVDNPESNSSVTRINGIDTDNNFLDFSILENSDPKNSLSEPNIPEKPGDDQLTKQQAKFVQRKDKFKNKFFEKACNRNNWPNKRGFLKFVYPKADC